MLKTIKRCVCAMMAAALLAGGIPAPVSVQGTGLPDAWFAGRDQTSRRQITPAEVRDTDTVISDLMFCLGDHLVEISLVVVDHAAFRERVGFPVHIIGAGSLVYE